MKTSIVDKLGWVALRGALLGVCHLSVYESVLGFLAQPLDPFGTAAGNVDQLTQEFIFNQGQQKAGNESAGDRVLAKLCLMGYFTQRVGEDPVSQINNLEKNEGRGENKELFINILFASIASSAIIAMVMTPFDMVFFKMMAKTANMSSSASFAQIAKDVFVT